MVNNKTLSRTRMLTRPSEFAHAWLVTANTQRGCFHRLVPFPRIPDDRFPGVVRPPVNSVRFDVRASIVPPSAECVVWSAVDNFRPET